MMNTFRFLFFLAVLLCIQFLIGQEVLEPIVTWDAGSADVELAVYNLKGQQVTLLIQGEMSAGKHTIDWDGRSATSGIYLCRLKSNGRVLTAKKMLLLK